MADRSVKVTLTAQAQGYISEMQKAAQATRDTGSAAEKLAQQQEAFTTMGRSAMVAGGAMAVGLGLSAKAAIDWDSAWAGVTKTVDGSPEQLAAVEDGLRGLAKVLPASHTEIAAVAEAAGQLGIQTPSVVAFTKTMIDLGETTNLSSEEAAMSLARFVNIMGTSQSDVDRLGSALVGLGNNFATTESEILAMAMRLSKSGVQIGLTEGEVLGLSTALSSVGIEAEAGGSAMSKVMINIAESVETGSDQLGLFAKTAGMSADDFAEKWKTAPAEALAAFVKGLSNAESQGSSTLSVLAELGISEVRMRDALLGSAAAADQFAGAMAMGNEEFEANTALVEEAEKRYDTVASKLSAAKNQIADMAISLGDHLLPAIGGAAEGIGGFADTLSGLDGPMGAVVAWGGLITAGILLTGGAALVAVPKIAAYKVALEVLNVPTAALQGKLAGLGRFMLGPWGIATAAAAISAGIFNKALDASVASAQDFEIALKQGDAALDVMQSKASGNEQGLMRAFVDVSQHLENLPALADKAASSGRGFWSAMSFNENAALDAVKAFGDGLATLSAQDLPAAKKAFREFVDDSGMNDAQALTILNEEMLGFKMSLLDAANAAGTATDDSSLLKSALEEVAPAAEEAAEGAQDGTDALGDLGESAQATRDEIEALADVIRGYNSPVFDMREANRRLEDSFKTLTESLSENGDNFDISSEAGRNNETALDGVAEATNRAAAGILEVTGDQEAMNAKLEEGRNALIDILAPYYESRDAAAAYVDQLDLISPEKVTQMVAETADATAQVQSYKSLLDGIPQVLNTTAHAQASMEILMYKKDANADGGMYAYADGGIAAYADGGLATGIYKGGAPIHKFAEPETGWEAYISGKPDQRDRNRQIWVETGERLGVMGELRDALTASAESSGGRRGGNNVRVTVNPGPGVSEEEIGRVSASKVVFALKGA